MRAFIFFPWGILFLFVFIGIPRGQVFSRTHVFGRGIRRKADRVSTESLIHPFDVSMEEARRIQNELARRVSLSDTFSSISDIDLVGGADVAFIPRAFLDAVEADDAVFRAAVHFPESSRHGGSRDEAFALAAVVTMEPKSFRVVETVFAAAPVLFPYIPGLLTFREGPAVLAAIGELSAPPEVMLYDGAGIAHPRGMGIASHMALLTGIPSIGCAKSLLAGVCGEPGVEKGGRSYIRLHDRVAGVCLRTRTGVKPVYVSPGSGFSVDGACSFVASLTGKYRLPEPTRIAHNLVTAKKRELTRRMG
jgi:deoxyribonuclease V